MAVIYEHGAPPTISALCALLEQRAKLDFWRSYTAQMLWIQNKATLKNFETPSYMELTKKETQTKDERTGKQIVDDLCAKLRSLRGR